MSIKNGEKIAWLWVKSLCKKRKSFLTISFHHRSWPCLLLFGFILEKECTNPRARKKFGWKKKISWRMLKEIGLKKRRNLDERKNFVLDRWVGGLVLPRSGCCSCFLFSILLFGPLSFFFLLSDFFFLHVFDRLLACSCTIVSFFYFIFQNIHVRVVLMTRCSGLVRIRKEMALRPSLYSWAFTHYSWLRHS